MDGVLFRGVIWLCGANMSAEGVVRLLTVTIITSGAPENVNKMNLKVASLFPVILGHQGTQCTRSLQSIFFKSPHFDKTSIIRNCMRHLAARGTAESLKETKAGPR